jgi:8-oxo-dGTP pyrophosphatase MutT (NUDIX family)
MATSEGSEDAQEQSTAIALLHRRLVCRNSVFQVFLDDVVDGSGSKVSDYLSIVPNNASNSLAGVAVLPVRNGQFGLLHAYRHPQGSYAWEIPKGFTDAGEQPVAAALRELSEETGLRALVGGVRELGHIAPVPSVIKARIALFAVQVESEPEVEATAEIGHGRLKFFNASAIERMASEGSIEEPCTLVAYYRYSKPT